MTKKYMFAITPIMLGLVCFISKAAVGSYVADDGTLVEPFFLLPIGFLLLFSGIIATLFVAISSLRKRNKTVT
ncbi:DUF3955 domain-containing protein [Paenibacillus yanchengensis]|uniref:DUF3955 domain-containing protein n=1 Tax=Paenibacillus yanchengensis TaxID=2035833 RepID=A0ABW4YJI2_9BACL